MKLDKENIGDQYQQLTKYKRDDMPKGALDFEKKPSHYKVYDKPLAVISLPEPLHEGGGPLWEILAARRTRRTYKPEQLSLAIVSQLLWAAGGKTKEGREASLRSAPSAGALYPIEMYLMPNDVAGLEKGIYHYDVPGHRLSLVKEGDFAALAAHAALEQSMLAKAGAVIFMTAIIERTRWKYRQRAYRYIYLDAGHIGQNICLAGESLALGVCPIGAFHDDEINEILGVDGVEETIIYAMTVGR